MKANEAPEKIYIQSFNISEEDAKFARKLYFDDVWTEEPELGETNIEYTRTDAFVEKACEKLKQLMYDSLMYQGRLERDKVIDNFIENFKERIKGK
jgi:hypothetical protein